jgi:hypothetical protein
MEPSSSTSEAARSIAREAYTYGFPLVENYKSLYKQAIDRNSRDFKAPINQVGHDTRVATPEDAQFVTPNTDTPYSYLWGDLRAEPIVVTMPKIETGRYYTGQVVDLYTHNIAYLGTRIFGNEGGNFLIAGPNWQGQPPENIRAVIPCETALVYVLFRVQLFDASDLELVKSIQFGIKAQPLSQFLGQPAPTAAPAIDWPPPEEGMTETPTLFRYLNFLLQFAPTHPSETELMARFAKLGIGAGKPFDMATLSPEIQQAIADGIKDFWEQDFAGIMQRVNAGELTSGDIFGTREFLQNNYLYRFTAAKLGIFGNSRDEASYLPYYVDADGNKLDASQGRYTLRFENNQLPPTDAFWSITLYDGKTQFLVQNPLQRYVLNSPMLETFKFGEDGSLTLSVQKDSPGTDLESNWLPAPNGPFYLMLRNYLPKPELFNGTWKQPPLQRIE